MRFILSNNVCTIHKELSCVDRRGPEISGLARIVPDVTRIYRIDHEYTQAFAHFRSRNTRIMIDRIIVKQPLDVKWKITRANQTIHRHGILKINRSFTEIEMRYLWCNYW